MRQQPRHYCRYWLIKHHGCCCCCCCCPCCRDTVNIRLLASCCSPCCCPCCSPCCCPCCSRYCLRCCRIPECRRFALWLLQMQSLQLLQPLDESGAVLYSITLLLYFISLSRQMRETTRNRINPGCNPAAIPASHYFYLQFLLSFHFPPTPNSFQLCLLFTNCLI